MDLRRANGWFAVWMAAALAVSGCATDTTNERILTKDDAGSPGADADPGADATPGNDAGPTSDITGEPDIGGNDAGPWEDAGLPPDMGSGGDSGGMNNNGLCTPVRDGVVTANEVPLQPGLGSNFRVALDAPIDTAGTMQNGYPVWDLSTALPGDEDEFIELLPVDDKWFADSFPTATYAVSLSAENDLMGVYEVTSDAVLMLGVVSPEGGLYRTELEYEPPITILKFPFEPGDTWSTTSDVSGRASGVVAVYDEIYEMEVDSEGELITPFGQFPVFRIRIELERDMTFFTETVRTYAFVSECFGTIAQIRSEKNEDDVEFTTAAEVRRVAP